LRSIAARRWLDAQPQGIRGGYPQPALTATRASPDAAQDAMHLADCEAMLVTQSEHGMTLVTRKARRSTFRRLPVKVR